jgi:hypothetical protein
LIRSARDLTGWYSILQKLSKGVAEAKIVMMDEEIFQIMENEVTGEAFEPGHLATNQELENVHIRVEYKWGMRQFSPHSISKRDNTLPCGLVGTDKVWPTCLECQTEEGDAMSPSTLQRDLHRKIARPC